MVRDANLVCRQQRMRYVEQYDSSGDVPNQPVFAECNECEEIRKAQNLVTDGKCPKCGYVGKYCRVETELCPACRAVPAKPKIARSPRQARVKRSVTPIINREQMSLYFDVNAFGSSSPLSQSAVKITAHGIDESVVTNADWNVATWEMSCFAGADMNEDSVRYARELTQSLSDFLRRLDEKYVVRCEFDAKSRARYWIRYFYENFGPADRRSIDF